MASAASSFDPDDEPAGFSPGRATALLADLRQAHQDLLGALAALEEQTARPEPDAAYTGARWRLSVASRKRRQLVAEASTALLRVLPPYEAQSIERLKSEEAQRLRESAAHVQAWPAARVAADWGGYRAASALIRAAMRRRIASERAALYPLLERFSRVG